MRGSRTRRSLNNRIGAFGRQGIVGEKCVHGGQPGAVAMPQQIGHLHRRRPPRERQQPIAGSVAREIDQNIDLVSADQLGKLRVAQADRAAPVIAERTEAFGGGVFGGDARIEIEFDVRSIMRGEQRFGEHRHRMLPEIRRYVTDPQSSPWCPIQREWRDVRCEVLRVAAVPVLVFGKDRFCGGSVPVVEREQQIAMAGGIIRLHRQRLAIAFLGLGMAALRKQRHSQVGQPVGVDPAPVRSRYDLRILPR